MLEESITVIVPTKNEIKNIPRLVKSIPPQTNLVIVDASTDGTADLVMSLRPRRTVTIQSQAKIAAARNLGALAARTEWLIFTDADVSFAQDYFSNLRLAPPADALYGPKMSLDGHLSYYQNFSRWQARFDRMGIPAVSGSNLVIRSDAFKRVGGFLPDLLVNEDTELGYRLKRKKFLVRFDPNLVVHAFDHRRLKRGCLRKNLHTLARCTLIYLNILPGLWLGRDWGYWSAKSNE